jgi:hypothetical protein
MMIRTNEDWQLLFESLGVWREDQGFTRHGVAVKMGIDWRRVREIEEFASPNMNFGLKRLIDYCQTMGIELEVIPHGTEWKRCPRCQSPNPAAPWVEEGADCPHPFHAKDKR